MTPVTSLPRWRNGPDSQGTSRAQLGPKWLTLASTGMVGSRARGHCSLVFVVEVGPMSYRQVIGSSPIVGSSLTPIRRLGIRGMPLLDGKLAPGAAWVSAAVCFAPAWFLSASDSSYALRAAARVPRSTSPSETNCGSHLQCSWSSPKITSGSEVRVGRSRESGDPCRHPSKA